MSKTVAQQQLGRQSGFANVRWARAELLYPPGRGDSRIFKAKMQIRGKLFSVSYRRDARFLAC